MGNKNIRIFYEMWLHTHIVAHGAEICEGILAGRSPEAPIPFHSVLDTVARDWWP